MAHKERKAAGYWDNKEHVFEEAKKYKTRTDFAKGCPRAYDVARDKHWLDEMNWFEEKQKSAGYWTYERCYEVALKCKNSREMYKKYSTSYKTACDNGWIKDYTWFESGQKPNGYWDYDRCMECALKCKNYSEFAKKYPSAKTAARKNGWIKDYPWYKGKKESGYWDDYDHCFEEAKKYNSRREFMFGNHSAYNAARRHRWLDDYDWFDKKNNIYTDNVYVVYGYEFKEYNSIYIGLTCHMNVRDNEHRNGKKKTGVRKFADKNNCEIPEPIILENNLNPEDAQDYEAKWVEHYKELGFNVINKAKCGKGCGALGSVMNKWTYKACFELAKTCTCSSEMSKKSKSAYEAARKIRYEGNRTFRWLDDYVWFVPKRKTA